MRGWFTKRGWCELVGDMHHPDWSATGCERMLELQAWGEQVGLRFFHRLEFTHGAMLVVAHLASGGPWMVPS